MYKSIKEPPGYWQHRGNGFNYHVGYSEGKTRQTQTHGSLWSCVVTGRLNRGQVIDND